MIINNEFAVKKVQAGKYLVYRKGTIIGKIEKSPEFKNTWNCFLYKPEETSVNTVTKKESVDWIIEKYKEFAN